MAKINKQMACYVDIGTLSDKVDDLTSLEDFNKMLADGWKVRSVTAVDRFLVVYVVEYVAGK